MSTITTRSTTRPTGGRRRVVAPFQSQTYRNFLYLALAFPLGLSYFLRFVACGALAGVQACYTAALLRVDDDGP